MKDTEKKVDECFDLFFNSPILLDKINLSPIVWGD